MTLASACLLCPISITYMDLSTISNEYFRSFKTIFVSYIFDLMFGSGRQVKGTPYIHIFIILTD